MENNSLKRLDQSWPTTVHLLISEIQQLGDHLKVSKRYPNMFIGPTDKILIHLNNLWYLADNLNQTGGKIHRILYLSQVDSKAKRFLIEKLLKDGAVSK